MSSLRRIISSTAFILLLMASASFSVAHASESSGFLGAYGLEVQVANQDESVSKIEALKVMLNYFNQFTSDDENFDLVLSHFNADTPEYKAIARACQLNLHNCDLGAGAYEPINLEEALLWFFKLADVSSSTVRYSAESTDGIRAWLEAKRLNLIESERITQGSLEQLLYRYSVSQNHFLFPYQEGMLLSYDNITPEKYHDLKEIDLVQTDLKIIRNDLRREMPLSYNQRKLLSKVNQALQKFSQLKDSLERYPYVLRDRSDMDLQVKASILKYGLQEVLHSYSYYYGHNASYRQHNVLTGVSKFHGKVYMPNQVIDYWQEVSDNNLSDFKYGWVIAGGIEQWQFGGGICGSSTMVFLPTWKAGFDILERRNHSKYYGDLYPMEDIGLDATVYQPSPNLRIKNNYDQPVVFNVVDNKETQTVTLEVIGNPIYQSIEIEGPIYVGSRHIQWKRHMTDYNGNKNTEVLNNYYRKVYQP